MSRLTCHIATAELGPLALFSGGSGDHPGRTQSIGAPQSEFTGFGCLPTSNPLSLFILAPVSVTDDCSVSGADLSPDSLAGSSIFNLSVALQHFDATDPVSQLPTSSSFSYTGLGSEVIKLVCADVALPSSLSDISLLTSLPSLIATHYQSPHLVLHSRDEAARRLQAAQLRTPRVLADRDEYVALVLRMFKLRMLGFTSQPRCVNGLFGVPKGDGLMRLILDARPANCYFVDPPVVKLPSPSHLCQLMIGPKQKV